MGTIRAGRAASALSNNRSSTPAACFEKTLKFTPPDVTSAPSGAARPGGSAGAAGARDAGPGSGANLLLIARSVSLRATAARAQSPDLEPGGGVDSAEQTDEGADRAGPAGLMAGAEAGAVVAVEVLVEQHVIAPV